MLMAMNIIMSSSILSIPVPGGHMYLNDIVIVTAAVLLDPFLAFLVGGVGAFIGDLLFYPAPMSGYLSVCASYIEEQPRKSFRDRDGDRVDNHIYRVQPWTGIYLQYTGVCHCQASVPDPSDSCRLSAGVAALLEMRYCQPISERIQLTLKIPESSRKWVVRSDFFWHFPDIPWNFLFQIQPKTGHYPFHMSKNMSAVAAGENILRLQQFFYFFRRQFSLNNWKFPQSGEKTFLRPFSDGVAAITVKQQYCFYFDTPRFFWRNKRISQFSS